jgi:hypothetical protein
MPASVALRGSWRWPRRRSASSIRATAAGLAFAVDGNRYRGDARGGERSWGAAPLRTLRFRHEVMPTSPRGMTRGVAIEIAVRQFHGRVVCGEPTGAASLAVTATDVVRAAVTVGGTVHGGACMSRSCYQLRRNDSLRVFGTGGTGHRQIPSWPLGSLGAVSAFWGLHAECRYCSGYASRRASPDARSIGRWTAARTVAWSPTRMSWRRARVTPV